MNTLAFRAALLTALLGVDPACPAGAATPQELTTAITSVGPKGEGNVAAQRALRELSQADAGALMVILRGFENAGPLAENWLRGAFESIADRELKVGRPLPTAELEQFVLDRRHDPRARRLAYEWLAKVDPAAPDRIIPGMLKDPSPEMRRDAVQRLIEQAAQLNKTGRTDEARAVYRQALAGAVHDDQVKAVTGPLKALGVEVDLPRHFGFLTRWHAVGPFDHRGGKGFDAVYPPESGVDLKAEYPTNYEHPNVSGTVGWKPLETDHEYGIVDIGKQLENYKGSCLYFTTDFVSPRAQPVEFRLGTPNAWKLWLNGKLLFAREEYHRGNAMDQYRVPAQLQPGRNLILLKICQNEQDEDWAQAYQFQIRVVDPSGTAVLPE